MTPQAVEDQITGESYIFEFRLLIKHPNIDPELISQTIGLSPVSSWKRGDTRKTLAGTLLKGEYSESVWSFSTK